MNAAELENVSFSYASAPSSPILRGVSLAVKEGEFVGIVGATGCGKSTMLYCLNGVIPRLVRGQFSGTARLGGKPIAGKGPADLAGEAGLLLQDPDSQLFCQSVREEALFGLHNLGVREPEASKRAEGALARVGMSEFCSRDPQDLSFGQKQKVALAGLIAMQPRILLLDEPVSALDYRSANAIYALIRELNREGTTVIAVEHNTEFLAEYADRIVLLAQGGVALDAPVAEAFADARIEEAGVRLPCATRISRELGIPHAHTPEALLRRLAPRVKG